MEIIKKIKKDKNYKPNKKLLAIVCEQFRTINEFRKFIITEEECPDSISIDSVPFTMEEYDMAGRFIIYKNKKLMIDIIVEHINRYTDFRFVKSVEAEKAYGWRDDINYLE